MTIFKFLDRMIQPLMPRIYSLEPFTIGLILTGAKAGYDAWRGHSTKKKAKKQAKKLKNKYNQAGAEANKIASEDLISKGDVNVASNIANRDARVNMDNYLSQVKGNMIAGGLGNSSIGALLGGDAIANMEGKIADQKVLALTQAGVQNKTYKDQYRMMAHDYKIAGKTNAIALRNAGEKAGGDMYSKGIGDMASFLMMPETNATFGNKS